MSADRATFRHCTDCPEWCPHGGKKAEWAVRGRCPIRNATTRFDSGCTYPPPKDATKKEARA